MAWLVGGHCVAPPFLPAPLAAGFRKPSTGERCRVFFAVGAEADRFDQRFGLLEGGAAAPPGEPRHETAFRELERDENIAADGEVGKHRVALEDYAAVGAGLAGDRRAVEK